MKTNLLFFLLLVNALLGFAETPYKCTLRGVVINRDSKTLVLKKYTDSRDIAGHRISIKNNAFEFKFDVDVTECYQLIFEDEFKTGTYRSTLFFPYAGVVNFKLNTIAKADDNEVTGGQLNALNTAFKLDNKTLFSERSKDINAKRSVLQNSKQYYTPERDSLIKLSNTIEHDKLDPSVYKRLGEIDRTGEGLTDRGRQVRQLEEALDAERREKRYAYVANNVNEFSYYLIQADIKAAKDNANLQAIIGKVFAKFRAAYPNHPYTSIIGNTLAGYNRVKVGQQLANISLPDMAGNIYSLEAVSKGKYTLVDFWGSWCGPCIAATRTMLPVYMDYKDKGFNIVGIAKEYKSTKDLQIALKREKYPWLNMVELDDKNGIWSKFGITNSAGMMLLVDKEGKIVAVDPSADEVRKILMANL